MPLPMFTSEAARPIMAYVRDLEGKVLTLRADRRRFRMLSFWLGVLVGGAVMLALVYVRYLH